MRIDKKLKKKLLLNAPYALFAYLFSKAAQRYALPPVQMPVRSFCVWGMDSGQRLQILFPASIQ